MKKIRYIEIELRAL